MTRRAPTPPSAPRRRASAAAFASALALCAALAFAAGCTATGDDAFAKAPGVDEVWLVQEKGAFDRETATARNGVVRVTVENRMERPARVSVVDAATRRTVGDFTVGIRQVNWEEVPLGPGAYEIVACGIGDGSRSLSRLVVT